MAFGELMAVGALVSMIAGAGAPAGNPQVIRGSRDATAKVNTLYGPTGLINIPTAYTADVRTGQLGMTFGGDVRGPSFNYGLANGIEVGAAFIDRDGGDDKLIGNAKITIVPQNFDWFEVGIGVIDFADALDQTVYVVGSADLVVPRPVEEDAIGFRVHLGAGTGMFKEKLFTGGELRFNNRFTAMVEWDAKNMNGGLRYVHDQNLRLQAGFRQTNLFFGATYVMRF